MSTTTLTMTAVERFISIYFPFRAKDICSLKVTRRIILGIVLIFGLFEIQLFFYVDGKYDENGKIIDCHIVDKHKSVFDNFYRNIDSVLYSYLPFSIMFLCNVAIIGKLVYAKYFSKSGASTLSKGATRITVMLVSVSLLFVVCTLPYAVIYQVEIDVLTMNYAIILNLMYTNHSINIIVYACTNSQFRKELKKLFGIKESSNAVHPASGTGTQTQDI